MLERLDPPTTSLSYEWIAERIAKIDEDRLIAFLYYTLETRQRSLALHPLISIPSLSRSVAIFGSLTPEKERRFVLGNQLGQLSRSEFLP